MNYKDMEGINQSSLKEILKHPSKFIKALERQAEEDNILGDKEHFIIGTLVDYMRYCPERIDEEYVFVDLPKISDTLKAICHTILELCSLNECPIDEENLVFKNFVLEATNLHEYQKTYKDDTKIKTVLKSCLSYLLIMEESKDKIIIPQEYKYKAANVDASLLSDPKISKYFTFNLKDNNVEILNHPQYQFTYKDVLIKCELDQVLIDHNHKVIIPIDLKTIGLPVYTFPYNFWKYRYDFQAAVYKHALCQQEFIRNLVNKGYVVKDFIFIVAEVDCSNSPLVYKVPYDVHDVGFNGGTLSNGIKLEGFDQAIERYKFHTEKDCWNYPKEYYNNNLIIEK